ncbi:MAG: hypothetical protein PUK59_04175 [Actinomycetaceae bacterium]|nr:hypothetical protein [Actinomycetaceae bacterium]MDY5854516.1 hypothetical protein [Arcanobacterium sp.]
MQLIKVPRFPMRLSAYTFGHFYFECMANFFLIAVMGPHLSSQQHMIQTLAIYNFCDYGLQLLIGLFCDVIHRNHYCAAVGALLFILGYFCAHTPLLLAGIVGLGAACIHVSLGRQVLLDRPHLYAPLAPFVASGSFGVFLGRQAAFAHYDISWPLLAGAVLIMVFLLAVGATETTWNISAERANATRQLRIDKNFFLAVPILVLAIIAQSFLFAILPLTQSPEAALWAAAIAILLGKALGGLCADRFGYQRTVAISSLIAVLCAGFAPSHIAVELIFLFAINIPAATVIVRLVRRLQPAVGAGFGLYKIFHLVGFFPMLFFSTAQLASPVLLILVTFLVGSLLCLEAKIGLSNDFCRLTQK